MWNPNPPSLPPPSNSQRNGNQKKNVSVTIHTPTRSDSNNDDNGKPPPPPNESPFRPPHQQAELEALRQRGLAKLLNKHFHEQSQTLAKEKAAVDRALQDLEERKRKASLSHKTYDNTPTRTQVEDMYHKMSVRKAECQQKERETLLLYQRYVHKFGPSGQVKAPSALSTQPPKDTASATSASVSVAYEETPLPREPELTTPKKGQSEGSHNKELPLPMFATSTPTKVVKRLSSVAEPPVLTAETDIEKEQNDDPSWHPTASMKAKSPSHQVVLGQQARTTAAVTTQTNDLNLDDSGVLLSHYLLETSKSSDKKKQGNNEEDDDDLSSLISGLTSVDSATTRQILLDCELTVATFLEEERRAVQAMLDEDSQANASKKKGTGDTTPTSGNKNHVDGAVSLPSLRGTPSSAQRHAATRSVGTHEAPTGSPLHHHHQELQTNAALEAETMAEQMQKILQDFELAQDDDGMMRSPSHNQTTRTTSSMGSPSATTASLTLTTTTDGTAVAHEDDEKQQGRPYPTANPNENWVVLYDDTYEREYYHETKSNTTQWHPPSMTGKSQQERSTVLDPSEVMPDVASVSTTSATSDRIQKYRAKRRRRRRKKVLRALAVALTLCASGAGGYYYYYHRPTEAIAEDEAAVQPHQPQAEQAAPPSLQQQPSSAAKRRMESAVRNMAKPKASSGASPSVSERYATPTFLKEEAKVLPTNDANVAEEEKETSSSKPAATSASPPPVVAYHARFSDQDDTSHNAQHQVVVPPPPRPWGCNVPFSYLGSKKCWVLADENPLFDCQSLVDSMLQ